MSFVTDMNKPQKRFFIRKIVKAESITEALEKEKDTPVLDCYLPDTDEFADEEEDTPRYPIGFGTQ